MTKSTNPFRWFDSSPEVIRLVVLMYVKYPLSLRNLEDLLAEPRLLERSSRWTDNSPDGACAPKRKKPRQSPAGVLHQMRNHF